MFVLNHPFGFPAASPALEFFGLKFSSGGAFCACLGGVDASWLRLLEKAALKVVLTGGSSKLPLVQGLGDGVVQINGHAIIRKRIDPTPGWIADETPDLIPVYPQLAGLAENHTLH